MNVEQRKRESGIPVGLKNIGNTCYFNSILQVYYHIPDFVRTIFEFKDEDSPLEPISSLKEDQEHKQLITRLESSRRLIQNLKKLFGQMSIGDKKYADPTQVLKSITSESGRPIELGDQQDIGEFNSIFI
jgi:ubiquitin carboxyl-terminal hydrolase 25/28